MNNSEDVAKVLGLVFGLVVVVLLNAWIFPNDLAKTVLWVLAAQ